MTQDVDPLGRVLWNVLLARGELVKVSAVGVGNHGQEVAATFLSCSQSLK